LNRDHQLAAKRAKLDRDVPLKPGAADTLGLTTASPGLVGPFSIDPRMTRDQWVLMLVWVLAAALFAAILLCHPS
jgi:hypothetical protein